MKTFTKHILLLALMLFGVSGAAWADYVPQKYTGPVDIATLQVGDTLAQGFELTGNQYAYFYFTENRAKENGTLLTTGTGYMRYLIDGYGPNGTVNKGPDVYTPVLEDQATDGNAWVVLGVQTSPQYIVTVAGAWVAPDPTIPVRLDDGNWLFQMPGANKQVYVQYTYPREMGNYVVYSTGVDQSKWYTLDNYTQGTVTGAFQYSENIDLPFEFEYNGIAYTQWSYNTDAEIMLGMRQPTEMYRPDNDSSLAIVLMGGFYGNIDGNSYVRWQTFGTAPNRVFVIEYHFKNNYQDGKYYNMQAQLAENGSITIVYGNADASEAYLPFWCGLSHTGSIYNYNDNNVNEPKNAYYYIDRTDHSYLYNERSNKSDVSWPGQYRWYTFSQTFDKCKMVDSLTYTVTPTSITLQWQDNDNAAGVSYNVVGFYDTIRLDPLTHEPVHDNNTWELVHDTVWVSAPTGDVFTSTSATFDNLNPNVMCTFIVRSQCSATNLSEATKLTVKTPCFPVATAELPYLMRFNEDEWDGEKDYDKTPRCWDKLFQARAGETLPSHVSEEYIRKDYNYNTGNIYLSMANSPNPIASIAILPDFDTALSALSVSFLAEVESSAAANAKLEVGYITDPTDTATFTAVETFTTANGLVASEGGDNAMRNPGEINVEFRGVTADARMAIRLSCIDPNNWMFPRVRIDSVAVEIAYKVDVTVNNDDFGTAAYTNKQLVAMPDSAHYLVRWENAHGTLVGTDNPQAVTVTSDTAFVAVFVAKPTLTLAQTDGGTLEAIVPQGGAIENISADMVSTGWQGEFNTQITEADLQQMGFIATDEAVAAAWTGAPASGYAYLFFGFTTEGKVKLLEFYDGINYGPTTAYYNRGYVYSNREKFYFTTGAGTSNVIASSTPNTYIIDYGTDVTVEAIPDEYYHLGHWANQAGTEVASVTPLTVTVTSDTTLMAVFERNMRILHGVPEGWTVRADSVTVAVSADSAVVPAGSQIMMIPPVPVKPTVKSFEVEKYLHPNEVPLTMEALTDGTIMVTEPKAGMRYAVNGGNKTDMSGTTQIDVTAGDKVAFYGNGTTIASYDGTKIAGGTAEVKVYGNIMSLVDEENFATAITLTETSTFRQLFYENYKLKDASGLLLPATTLTESCYEQMFTNDTILTAAPALPATTLAPYCYQSMFNFCYALTTAPALPATTMESNCYNQMFYYCTGLTTAPALPATQLAEECYNYMFYNCTGLTTAPALPATTLADYCYSYMFAGCTGLTTAPALPATTLADYCYYYMFANDTNLTTAPSILPATTLASRCYQRMFHGCIRLTTAPKLPATTLANHCYNYMFAGCTSLTTAPELPATTLVPNCYAYMFQNCSNLRSVTCMATSGINSNNSTVKWLSNTAATGIFVANNAAEWPNNASGIPEGWNRTTTISFATASDCGKIVCSAGHLHDAGSQLPEGCTVVGIMAKVNTDGHGLILGNLEGRLEDAYSTINLFYPTVNYGGTTLKRLPGYMLENLPNCATLGNIPTSNWCVASMDDYKAMFVNLGSQSAEQSYDDNVNATITAAGGKAITDGSEYQEWGFWCTSKYDDRHGWFFKKNSWSYADWEEDNTIYSRYLLPVLAF